MTKNNMSENPISYGGQAVMEGVLMRGKKAYAMAVRRPDGGIEMIEKPISTISERFKILKLPLIRGFVALCSSMALGFSALSQSAEVAMAGETEPASKFEKWLQDKLGDKLNNILMTIAMVFAVILAVGLFMLLPTFLASLINAPDALRGAVEGLIRVTIFVSYVFLISRFKDVQRVFQYHGAEHKAIDCYEKKLPLTTENVAECSRLHKRCGTSFMLVVMVVTMVLFMIIRIDDIWIRFASRIALLPVIAGISYEISVKWAGSRDNWLVRAIIFPGMLIQRITTKDPDADQIEVAVAALEKAVAQDAEEA